MLFSSIILHSSESIPSRSEVAKLYIATFNRAPDSLGLDYWTTQPNFALSQIAKSFFDQEETQVLYPSTISNAQFIALTYHNLFHRTPDAEGARYWEGYLEREPCIIYPFVIYLNN